MADKKTETDTAAPVETLNQAGTAPAAPTGSDVVSTHKKAEEQRARAETADAAQADAIRKGANPSEARDAAAKAARESKAEGPAPENKSA